MMRDIISDESVKSPLWMNTLRHDMDFERFFTLKLPGGNLSSPRSRRKILLRKRNFLRSEELISLLEKSGNGTKRPVLVIKIWIPSCYRV